MGEGGTRPLAPCPSPFARCETGGINGGLAKRQGPLMHPGVTIGVNDIDVIGLWQNAR